MALPIVAGALMQCPFGTLVVPLAVDLSSRVQMVGVPPSRLPDDMAVRNVATFGMCSSLANPVVAAATAAALGVLTPMPCVPAIVSPWLSPVPDVVVGGVPVVKAPATCQCAWGGVVEAKALPSTVQYP